MKQSQLADMDPHMRDARTRGIPFLGSGAVFPVQTDVIEIRAFPIPDEWPRAFAMDVGWQRTAALWGAHDRTSDILYLYDEHYVAEENPNTHANAIMGYGTKGNLRAKWIPGVVDPAARGRAQADGERLIETYRDLGLDLEAARSRTTDAACHEVWLRLSSGRLKVFSHLQYFFKEYLLYRRDKNGKIIESKARPDHLMDCYDADTEVLTRSGWKRFAVASKSDEMATVNLQTDEIEYQLPEQLIARDYVGEMVRFGGHKLDGLVTPTHRMVVYERGANYPTIKLAKDLTIWDRIKLQGKWSGVKRGPVKVIAPNGKGSRWGLPHEVDPCVWAELLGWYVAEGSCQHYPGKNYFVNIAQKTKKEQLRELLDRTPWKWSYPPSSNSFVTSGRWLYEQVQPLGDKYEKRVPQWIKDSEPRVIEAFIKGAVLGDGWIQAGRRSYCSVSKCLADDMQELFIKVGRSASVLVGREASSVGIRINGRTHATVDQFWTGEWQTPYGLLRDSRNKPNYGRQQYAGKVYCASVPNGTLIVRRNGKPMVCGNCLKFLIVSGLERMKPVPYAAKHGEQREWGDPYAMTSNGWMAS